MTAAAPIEDFLEAITAQLDKTQDSLRLKAVNRPLTFALKDFHIDLSVFVEMDRDGQVRLRPSGPNESGASVMKVGFTTITRPMIEENTIAMELAQSPSLEEAGLAPEESKQLERLGVRNMAQLERLSSRTDEDSVSRFSGVDVGRLRQALQVGRPRIDYVQIGSRDRQVPINRNNNSEPPSVSLRPGQSRLRLRGSRLSDRGQSPRVRLDGADLPISAFSQSHIDIDVSEATGGVLEVELADGVIESFALATQQPPQSESDWSPPPGEERVDA